MKEKEKNPLRNKINLFIRIMNDLQNYRIDPEEKENIFSIPENMKNVLREIISSEEISEFIIDISNEKSEKTKKNNEKSKKKMTIEVNEEKEETKNLFNYKKYQNISCFGQNSINNLNQFYYSVNETYDLIENLLNVIFIIEKEAFYTYIDILKNNIQKENSFLFINPDNYYNLKAIYKKKKSYSKTLSDNYKDLINESEKKFISIDNYNKFVKKEIEEKKNNVNNQQYDIFVHEMNKRKKSIKSKKKIKYPLLLSPLNSSKDVKLNNNTFIKKKMSYENLCKLPNLGILNVIYRNKNIKNEIYNSKVKRGLIKSKNKVYLNDYDYCNILDIKNPINKTKKNYLNSIFNKYYNTQIYKKK